MLKKDLEQELNRTKLILDYAREELKLKDNIIKEIENYVNATHMPIGYKEYILQVIKENKDE